MNLGLRTRLIGTLLIATLLCCTVIAVAARQTMASDMNAMGTREVQIGVAGFQGLWDQEREHIKTLVGQLAISDAIRRDLGTQTAAKLAGTFNDTARQGGFSFLMAVDTHGKVLAAANGIPRGTAIESSYIERALTGETVQSAGVLEPRELALEQLTSQVAAEVKTPDGQAASPTKQGLAVVSAVTVSDPNGRTIGAVYGGVVLNHFHDLVDRASRSLGGKSAILLGDTIVAGTISRPDGMRLADTTAPLAANVMKSGTAYTGVDTEGGVEYLASIAPLFDDKHTAIGALWYGVPLAKFTTIQQHTMESILLWGFIGLLVALLVAIPVYERVSRLIVRRSRQVSESAKELAVIVVGSEVSGDHIAQTRETVERAGDVLMELGAGAANGEGAGNAPVATSSAVSEKILTLSALNAELLGDVVVIDTLAQEMNARMQQATSRVAELNDVADGLKKLVTGSRE